MTRINRILVIGAGVCGAIALAAVAATFALVAIIIRLGMLPFTALFAPRNAQVLTSGRRQRGWHGMHVRVGAMFLLDPDAEHAYGRDVSPTSALLLEPATGVKDGASGYVQLKQDADVDRDQLKRLRPGAAHVSE